MRLSVIVPTLNEASCIEETLTVVRDQNPDEIVISDAGSRDSTTAIASNFGIVVEGEAGRANQMNLGAATATGDILVFLHADTILPEDGLNIIRDTAMSVAPSGTFRLEFDNPHPLLRFSSFCTRFESLNICFGDRCIFTNRETFDQVGGYPSIPIFEDVEFVKRIARLNQFAFLKQSVLTSARRYHDAGVWTQQWKNTRLWLRYQRGADPVELAKEYRYESRDDST